MLKEMNLKAKLFLFVFIPIGYGLLLAIIRYFLKDQQVDPTEFIATMIGIAIANFFITSITPTKEEEAERKQRSLKEYIQDFIINGSGFHKFVLAIYLSCILILGLMLVLFT